MRKYLLLGQKVLGDSVQRIRYTHTHTHTYT